MRKSTLFLCVIAIFECAHVSAESLANTQDEILAELVETYNRGSEANWTEIVETRYSDGWTAEEVSTYWVGVFRTYGPLKLKHNAYRSKSALETWAFGEITHAWIAIELRFNNANEIVSTGLLQGEYPTDYQPICPPNGELKDHLTTHFKTMVDAGFYAGQALVNAGDQFHWSRNAEGGAKPLPIASVTKLFTAAVVQQIVLNRSLSYHAEIQDFIPEYPKKISSRVTLADLLLHTSGIELDTYPEFLKGLSHFDTTEALLELHLENVPALLKDQEEFGSQSFDYTNEGYDLALIMAERVTGKSYPELLRTHVLHPAGLLHTECGSKRCGPSGINSTVEDLNRFIQWLKNSQRLQLMMKETVSVGPEEQGLGPRRYLDRGYIGHAGGTPNASAELRYYDDESVIATIAQQRGSARVMANRLRELMICVDDQSF